LRDVILDKMKHPPNKFRGFDILDKIAETTDSKKFPKGDKNNNV